MKRALLLTDGKAGHENQSLALARSLGLEPVRVLVKFRSPLAKAASYLFDRFALAVPALFELSEIPPSGEYAAVIGTGSGCFYAVKVLARKLKLASAVVLYPRGYRLGGFSVVFAPEFDRPRTAKNVVTIPVNLVANDEGFYQHGAEALRQRAGEIGAGNLVAVIVGGPNDKSTMTAAWMREELKRVFADNPGAYFAVTTSRRTPQAVEAAIAEFPWNYALYYSRDKFNPIPGFVALARRIYVTAESTGMLSEVCTCGSAEVVAMDNLLPGEHKFRRFVRGLQARGAIGGRVKLELSKQLEKARELIEL